MIDSIPVRPLTQGPGTRALAGLHCTDSGHWTGLTGTRGLSAYSTPQKEKEELKVHSRVHFGRFARPFGDPDTTALGFQHLQQNPIQSVGVIGDRLETGGGARARSARFLLFLFQLINHYRRLPISSPFGSFILPRPVLIAVLTLFNHHKPLQTDTEVRPRGLPGPDQPDTHHHHRRPRVALTPLPPLTMAQYAASVAQQAAAGHHSLSPLSPSASGSASVGTAPPLTPSGTAPAAATAQSGAGSASASQPQDEPRPRSQSQSGAGPSATGGGASSTTGTQHKRVYQACIPCRRRKVRCDLGSVDNPSDPPCVRCRRESKECYFSATRRKRKVDDDMTDIFDDPDHDDYILRNGRKQLRSGESPVIAATIDRRLYSDVPLTPGGSRGRAQPLRRPGDGDPKSTTSTGGARSTTGGEFGAGEANTPLENFEARTVMRREVYGPHDALDLLYKAATDKLVDTRDDRSQRLPYADVARLRSPMHRQDGESAAVGSSSRTNLHAGRPGLDSRHSSHHNDRPGHHSRHASRQEAPAEPIDPELTKRDISQEPGYNEALKAWARFRFVRAGWFTAQEAIDYIE